MFWSSWRTCWIRFQIEGGEGVKEGSLQREEDLSMASHSQAPVWGTSGHPHGSRNNHLCMCVCASTHTMPGARPTRTVTVISTFLSGQSVTWPSGFYDPRYWLLKGRMPISETATKQTSMNGYRQHRKCCLFAHLLKIVIHKSLSCVVLQL